MRIPMREKIIQATIKSLKKNHQERFYQTERGYQGRFYCALQQALDDEGIIIDGLILEMEYQKRENIHHTSQRPDITLHIPVEYSGAERTANNYAIWALKRRGYRSGYHRNVTDDFNKLNIMFKKLNYPLGFLIIINSDRHMLDIYEGEFRDRIISFAVKLNNGAILIKQAYFQGNMIIENDIS